MTPVLQIIKMLHLKMNPEEYEYHKKMSAIYQDDYEAAMKLTPPPPKHQIIIGKDGKPKAKPPRMSTSAKIAKRKNAEKPRLTKRVKGAQSP